MYNEIFSHIVNTYLYGCVFHFRPLSFPAHGMLYPHRIRGVVILLVLIKQILSDTVDGWNPAPPEMYQSL